MVGETESQMRMLIFIIKRRDINEVINNFFIKKMQNEDKE